MKVNGVDVFDPNTGEVRSDDTDGIAAWFIDTDYNEESFFVRHAYFLGANDPYKALKTTLQAEIDEDAWATPLPRHLPPVPEARSRPDRREGHQPLRRRGDEGVPGLSAGMGTTSAPNSAWLIRPVSQSTVTSPAPVTRPSAPVHHPEVLPSGAKMIGAGPSALTVMEWRNSSIPRSTRRPWGWSAAGAAATLRPSFIARSRASRSEAATRIPASFSAARSFGRMTTVSRDGEREAEHGDDDQQLEQGEAGGARSPGHRTLEEAVPVTRRGTMRSSLERSPSLGVTVMPTSDGSVVRFCQPPSAGRRAARVRAEVAEPGRGDVPASTASPPRPFAPSRSGEAERAVPRAQAKLVQPRGRAQPGGQGRHRTNPSSLPVNATARPGAGAIGRKSATTRSR